MTYRVGSLFAGVGGVCLGFKQAGCKVVWANEIDENACKTYALNHAQTTLIKGDVRTLHADKLAPIDILTAGFPCQPFSQAGKGRGFADPRGQLFFEIPKLLSKLSPKAYFLENVKTLATQSGGAVFSAVREALVGAGYSFIPFVLNAATHSGVPQGRERIYIVGFRGEAEYFFAKPTKSNSNLASNARLSANFKIPTKIELSKGVGDFLQKECALPSDFYRDENNKIHKRVMECATDKNTVYQYRRYFVRDNKSGVCPTLTANMGAGGHNVPIVLDGKFPRRLSPKECFNLQGFPRSFELPQNVARGQLYRQAGNCVVVPMVKRIAEEIIRVLDEAGR